MQNLWGMHKIKSQNFVKGATEPPLSTKNWDLK